MVARHETIFSISRNDAETKCTVGKHA